MTYFTGLGGMAPSPPPPPGSATAEREICPDSGRCNDPYPISLPCKDGRGWRPHIDPPKKCFLKFSIASFGISFTRPPDPLLSQFSSHKSRFNIFNLLILDVRKLLNLHSVGKWGAACSLIFEAQRKDEIMQNDIKSYW